MFGPLMWILKTNDYCRGGQEFSLRITSLNSAIIIDIGGGNAASGGNLIIRFDIRVRMCPVSGLSVEANR